GARRRHGAAVKRDKALYDRESEPESTLRALDALPALREQIKYPRQQLGRDADPVVLHFEHHVVALAPRTNDDATLARRVLRRVRQQVRHDLRHALRIDVHLETRPRHLHDQMMTIRIDERLRHLDRLRDDARDLDWLARQRDLAARDARDIEQIV